MARRRHLELVGGGDSAKPVRGRPGKSLEQHVADGSFEKRKHAELLVDDPLVDDEKLRKLQQQYRRLRRDDRRAEVALEFERLVRDSNPERSSKNEQLFHEKIRKLGKPGTGAFAIKFFETFYVWDDGSPWRLDPWQKDVLREVYRRDRQQRRVYQEILLGICRGQGKTPLASGVNTLEISTAPKRMNAYQLAGSKLQASLGTGYARHFVDDSDLKLVLRARARSIERRDGRGSFTVVSSDGRLSHGLHGRIAATADELWLYKSAAEEQGYIAFESALQKDVESFLLGITTAGYSKRSLLGRKYKRGLACPSIETHREGFLTIGRDLEAGFLMWWYGMPEGYELDLEDDKAVLRALKLANPGSWTNFRGQLRSLRRAMNGDVEDDDDIQDVFEWLRLCLNYWTATKGSWLKAGAWRALEDKTVKPRRGADVYVAVDAAHTYDTTAVSYSWFDTDLQKVVTRCKIFSVRADAPAHVYVDDFYDAAGDTHVAETFIHELADVHKLRVREVVGDPNYFGRELARLGQRFLTAPVYPQSVEMRDYVQRFYRDVHGARIVTDGDPIVTAHIENIVGEKSSDGYWVIKKRNNPEPMDGGTATIISNGRAQPDRQGVSVYEKRGLEVIEAAADDTSVGADEPATTKQTIAYDPELARRLGLDVDDLDQDDDDDEDLDFDLDDADEW
jgi:phage terminase large subunit-like protein